jgi:hypothetical protein
LLLVVSANLTPVSPLQPEASEAFTGIFGWRGESKREGASPPLRFSPPLGQMIIRIIEIRLFEKGIKGVSMQYQVINYRLKFLTSPFKRLYNCAPGVRGARDETALRVEN